jgi:Ala-tRNA(Pro) deacylase
MTSKLREFLDSLGVTYDLVQHPRRYTAHDTAISTGGPIAKTVMVRIDGELAMVVVPSWSRVHFEPLRVATGAKQIALATESEFRDRFPDCEVGAMPPFGNLYGMTVYLDENLADREEIAFNACSHTELMRVRTSDFVRVCKPRLLRFPVPTDA